MHIVSCESQELKNSYKHLRSIILRDLFPDISLPNDEHHKLYIVCHKNDVIGCYQLEDLANQIIAIRFFGICEESRRLGFGSRVLRAMEFNLLHEHSYLSLYLNCSQHTLPFYHKNGFVRGPQIGSPLIKNSFGMYKSLN